MADIFNKMKTTQSRIIFHVDVQLNSNSIARKTTRTSDKVDRTKCHILQRNTITNHFSSHK